MCLLKAGFPQKHLDGLGGRESKLSYDGVYFVVILAK